MSGKIGNQRREIPQAVVQQRRGTVATDARQVIQRALADPRSLRADEVKILQRTVGNQATLRLLAPLLQNKPRPAVTQAREDAPAAVQRSMPGLAADALQRLQTATPATLGRGEPGPRQTSFFIQRTPVESKSSSAPVAESISRAAQPQVQRKPGFLEYLGRNRLPTTVTTAEHEEIILAWVLDQNIHDLVDLITESQLEPVLQNAKVLGRYGLTLEQVLLYLRSKGAPAKDADRLEHMQFLHNVMRVAPSGLTTNISSSIHKKSGKEASVIQWHGLTPWGAGTGVTLLMRPGGMPTGSTPLGSPVWMKRLEQHIPPGGSTTIYVQGHLLNHNIGGPGLDYNMVPLTGKPAKNVGANDANAVHLNLIEKAAKETWDEVSKGSYTAAEYIVVPDYSRISRAETAQVRAEANKMKQIRQLWFQDRINSVGQMKPEEVANSYTNLLRSLNIPVTNPLPPLQQMINELAGKLTHDDIHKTLESLVTAKHPLAQLIDTQIDKGILNASAAGEPMKKSVADLLYLLDENASTWEAEDRYVPTRLQVSLKWQELDGTKKASPTNEIPIELATNPALVHFRPKKKSEDA